MGTDDLQQCIATQTGAPCGWRRFVEIAAIAFSGLVKACTSKRGMDTSQLAVFEVYADSVSKLLLQHPSDRMRAAGALTCDTLITCQDSYVDHSKLTAYTPLLRHVIADAGAGEDAASALRAAFRALRSLLGLSDPPTLAKHAESTLPLLLGMTRKELHSGAASSTGASKDDTEAPPSTLQLLDGTLHSIARGLNAAVGSTVIQGVFQWMDKECVWEDHSFVAHVLRRLDRQSAGFPSAGGAGGVGGGSAAGVGSPPQPAGSNSDSWGPILGTSVPMLLLRHASRLAEGHRHRPPPGAKGDPKGTLLVTGTPTGESGDGTKLLGMLFAARTLLQEAGDSLRAGELASDAVDLTLPLLVASVAHDVHSAPSIVTPGAAAAALARQRPMGSVHEEVGMLLLCLAQRLSTAHELHRLATAVGDWYGEFQEELLDLLQATEDGQALVKASMQQDASKALLQASLLGGPLPLSSSHLVTPARLHVLALLMSLLKQVVSLRWQHSDSGGGEASGVSPASAQEAALMAQVQLSNSFVPVPPQDVLVEVLLRDMCDASAAVRSMALQSVLVSLTSPLEWTGSFQGTTMVHGAVLRGAEPPVSAAADACPVLDEVEASVLSSGEPAAGAVHAGMQRHPHYPLVIRQMFSLPLTPLQLLRLHSALLHSVAASTWREHASALQGAVHGTMATRICAAVLQRAGMQGVWFVWGLGTALARVAVQLSATAQSPDQVQRMLVVATVATAMLHLVVAPAQVASHVHEAHEAARSGQDAPPAAAQQGTGGMLAAVPESDSDEEAGEESTPAHEQPLDVSAALQQLLEAHGVPGALTLPCPPPAAKAACQGVLLPQEAGCTAVHSATAAFVTLQLSARSGGLLLRGASAGADAEPAAAASANPASVSVWSAALSGCSAALLLSAPFQHTAGRVADVPSRYVKRCFPALANSTSAELRQRLQRQAEQGAAAFIAPGSLSEQPDSEHVYVHGMFRLMQVLQPTANLHRVVSCGASAAAELAFPAPASAPAELHQHTTATATQSADSVLEYMAHLLSLPLLPLPVPPFDVEEEDEDGASDAGSEGARSAAGVSLAGSAAGAAAAGSSRPTSPANSVAAGDASVGGQGSLRGGVLLTPPLAPLAFGDAVHLEGDEALPTPQAAVERMQALTMQLQRARDAHMEAAEAQRLQLLQAGVALSSAPEHMDVRLVAPPGADNAGQLLPPPASALYGTWPVNVTSLASSSAALRAAGHTESMPHLLPHGVAGAPKVAM